eukprot:TRINITY_DN22172_c0_g1_i1.p1 TRINITY_DN22172_c0_g1~~TRINITY_DN22172_c0_g1_i1.p1  ORF type:complete len:109 (-),score=17.23 TRINITY_DN22172_c0_g1_i1:10-336(-)
MEAQSEEERVTSLDLINSDHPMFNLTQHSLLFIVFVLGACASADFAMVFPSLWSYTEEIGYHYVLYGLLAAAYNVGQIIGAPLLGFWAEIGRAVQQECRDRSRMPSSA